MNDIEVNTPPILATLLDAGYSWESIKDLLDPEREAAIVESGVGPMTFREFCEAFSNIGYIIDYFAAAAMIRQGRMVETLATIEVIAARTSTLDPERKKNLAVELVDCYLEGRRSLYPHEELLEVIQVKASLHHYLMIVRMVESHIEAIHYSQLLADLATETITTAYRAGVSLESLSEVVTTFGARKVRDYLKLHDAGASHSEIMNILDICSVKSPEDDVRLLEERFRRYELFRNAKATHMQARELSKYSELHDLFVGGLSSISRTILRTSLGLPEMARQMLAEFLAGKC